MKLVFIEKYFSLDSVVIGEICPVIGLPYLPMSSWDISYIQTNDSWNTIVNRLAKSKSSLIFVQLQHSLCFMEGPCYMLPLYVLIACSTSICLEEGTAMWRCGISGDTASVKFVFNMLFSQVSNCLISAKNSWEPIRGGGDAPGCLQDHTMVAFRSILDSLSVGCCWRLWVGIIFIIINRTYLGLVGTKFYEK